MNSTINHICQIKPSFMAIYTNQNLTIHKPFQMSKLITKIHIKKTITLYMPYDQTMRSKVPK
ncbi:hypothetical protein F383_13563 [Gossypium arboreum]|uniref:Uncharacterized protein n=1 Tax=Gossypium arboreum TaxID=29729 RepID=A0A0B0NIJ5_GOSAR|nr:hypothetical protein F383_13563 [Gossypium arboreum]